MPKPGDPQQNLDEKSWNLNAKEVVENEGREAHPGQKYRASKVLAEIGLIGPTLYFISAKFRES